MPCATSDDAFHSAISYGVSVRFDNKKFIKNRIIEILCVFFQNFLLRSSISFKDHDDQKCVQKLLKIVPRFTLFLKIRGMFNNLNHLVLAKIRLD